MRSTPCSRVPTLTLLALLASGTPAEIVYVGDDQGRVCTYDTAMTSAAFLGSLVPGFAISQALGMAYDPVRDRVLLHDRNTMRVYTMHPTTGVASLLFTALSVFQGGAVLGDTLWGIDENNQRFEAYSLTTFARTLVGGPTNGHTHALGIDQTTGRLFARNTGFQFYEVNPATGMAGATSILSSTNEDIDFLPSSGNWVGTNYGRELKLINGMTGAESVLMDTTALTAAGVTGSVGLVAVRQSPSTLRILSIAATPTAVPPGVVALQVDMIVENFGSDPLTMLGGDLVFLDAGAVDVSADYLVAALPGNPTTIAAMSMETLAFAVDIVANPTLGMITIDGTATSFEPMAGRTHDDTGANVTDTWDVIGAVPMVRVVDAPDSVVGQGGTGYPVSVAIENTGLAELTIAGVAFTFTGSADRTAEYAVTADPGNPTTIASGAQTSFLFSVDVDAMATVELVTLDAGCTGTTTVSGAAVSDPDADITDTWNVVMCTAPFCGDCNLDMQLNILDALLAAQHSAALVTLVGVQFSNCNVFGILEPDPQAAVTVLDALTIAQVAAGLPVALMCC